ncbi:M12 family metallo-peptidase [Nocardioides sp.]|uniref:M12 family metallo-peptidase n=1 Tax=Nocardioides sp. TaxID=35761 RepID=UPI0035684D53
MSRPVRRTALGAAAVLVVAALPAFAVTSAGAAADDVLFTPAPDFRPAPDAPISPEEFTAVRVDLPAVESALTPSRRSRSAASSSFEIDLPTPTGERERFEVEQTQRMEPRLAAAHPEISTWSGASLDRPGTTVALDITPLGFHAFVRGPEGQGSWYVDPAANAPGTTTHLSYYGGSLPSVEEEFIERIAPEIEQSGSTAATPAQRNGGGTVVQRTYRLALTSDPAYADHFGSENVTAAKVTLVNRVNQVYNDDMAIELELVDATDELNLDTVAKATGPNGPCGAHPCFDPATNNTAGQLDFCDVPSLGRNRTVLGQIVGADNYDVGHLALGVNGGGIAYLGVVGGEYKGGGCTGLPRPEGDIFAIDFVAHELGHQFAGNHTFNGIEGACSGGNRKRSASVEPGSGSSVMAYAGICGQDDLQPHTDPYFSQHTIREVAALTDAAPWPLVEVQTVSLRGFDTDGESITLGYPGAAPVTLTRGGNYTAAGVEAAVEAMTGGDVTVRGWGFDPLAHQYGFPGQALAPDDTGFQVIFAGSADPETQNSDFQDMADLTLTSSSPGVSGFVGETTVGGLSGNAGEKTVTDNHAPEVLAPADRTIPVRTPFSLTGSGSDADGDSLTYLWEQTDHGSYYGTALASNDKRNGPLFRVFSDNAQVSNRGSYSSPSPGQNSATGRPTRTFPDMWQVLLRRTNAKSGTCPWVRGYRPLGGARLDCYSEFLPTDRYVGTAGSGVAAMNFRLTARDGRGLGGGVGHDDVKLTLDRKAGPFLVTFPDRRETLKAGKRPRIRWAVNGTRRLASHVRIRLSFDGGRTWPKVLAWRTPNDGVKRVRLPQQRTSRARIKIEALDNYFFDTSDRGFRIR